MQGGFAGRDPMGLLKPKPTAPAQPQHPVNFVPLGSAVTVGSPQPPPPHTHTQCPPWGTRQSPQVGDPRVSAPKRWEQMGSALCPPWTPGRGMGRDCPTLPCYGDTASTAVTLPPPGPIIIARPRAPRVGMNPTPHSTSMGTWHGPIARPMAQPHGMAYGTPPHQPSSLPALSPMVGVSTWPNGPRFGLQELLRIPRPTPITSPHLSHRPLQ